MMLTLTEIKNEVDRLAARIDAPGSLLPTYGHSIDDAHPHIEVGSSGYHYVIEERGEEIKRLTATSLDELLYFIFRDVAFSMAGRYEVAHRIKGQDSRRLMFEYQVELLASLSPEWAEREKQDHQQILRQHPFDDQASLRAELCKHYADRGYSPESAWEMACKRYPLPTA